MEIVSRSDCLLCGGTGLIQGPSFLHIPAPTYVARIAQARAHRLQFCTCSAGIAYHHFLLRKNEDITAGRDKFPNWQDILDAAATPTANGE